MTTVRDRIYEYQQIRVLFPRCNVCGRDLSDDRLMTLRISPANPRRFLCRDDEQCTTHLREATA